MITIYDINAAIEIEGRVLDFVRNHQHFSQRTHYDQVMAAANASYYRLEALKHIRDNLT